MSKAQELADEFVRYCPECGLIGPVTTGSTCCPDSFGMNVRRWQAEAPSDSTLKLAEMILADCGHSTAISTRLRDRVAERIERHLAAQPTEASCRSTNADGHVLLPFEPTDEMEVAAEDAYEESGSPFPNWKAVYRAMRDAAPSPDGKAEPAQVNISPAERAANAETLERWARASKAEQAEAPSDEVVAVEFYRLNPSAALFDFRNRVATQPTASNAEARGIVAMEHIGTLNPDYPHRLKCKQCGSEAGQVLRAGSDIFDCLCCGFFTYVEGVNLNARAALASKPPQGEQKPDGRLHVDGYFTWSEGKRPAYIADRGLPCDFYLAPAQPEQVAQDREALVDLIAQHLSGTYHCTRVWEAWRVGTMSQDDFEDVGESDTPAELADAILASLNKGTSK